MCLRSCRLQAASDSAKRARDLQVLLLHESVREFYDAQIDAILHAVAVLREGKIGGDQPCVGTN